ncbi:MAG: HNH endonuclease [Candidatus Krumholzibacteria bacterium]|nr:HNH endonuclease [Candidatus Krumholzibacteria bacterium]
MSNIPEFRPNLDAAQAHIALKKSVEILDRAQHCVVLWFGEIMRRELHRDLGFSTMRSYATEELGFSPTRAGDFIRLARKLESLPMVKKEVASGKLGYTKAREISSVADPTNELEWVKVAKELSRRELEATVRQAKELASQQRKENPDQGELMPRPVSTVPPAIIPVRVGFELTPAQYARYEAMLAKIGHRGSKSDLLLDMVEALLVADANAPRGAFADPHYQIHIHECPTCAKATVQTPNGEIELTKTEIEAAREDAQIHKPGERIKSIIPPRIRREVLARDRHCCRRKGCNHTRFLEIHHIVPRSEGGTNDPENLVTLCTACHKLLHEKGGDPQSLLVPLEDKVDSLV